MSPTKKTRIFDQETLIPLGFAVAFIGTGAFWLAQVDFQAKANAAEMADLRQETHKMVEYLNRDLKVQIEVLHSIDTRLSTIEFQVRGLNKKQ